MAFLKVAKKCDLQEVARFIELDFQEADTRDVLIEKITAKPGYDSAMLKEILAQCKDDRMQAERIAEEKERHEREVQMRSLSSTLPANGETRTSNQELSRILSRFDPRKADVGLYLVNFERQARLLKIPNELWVSHLLGLVTPEMAQVIAREDEDKAKNYEHVKELLLRRFKLNPEKFRQRFFGEQRRSETSWCDFVYELTNDLDEWVAGLNVNTFEDLKRLMVVDQLRRRLPKHVKEHFMDVLGEVKCPQKLADMADAYETKREQHFAGKGDSEYPKKRFPYKASPEMKDPTRPMKEKIDDTLNPKFERPRTRKCYTCQKPGHYSYDCPEARSGKRQPSEKVARIVEGPDTDELMRPYMFELNADGKDLQALRDSGASIDVIKSKYVEPHQYTGKNIWVRQGLDDEARCLPLANVTLKAKAWELETIAAVTTTGPPDLDYIFSNRSLTRLEELGLPFEVEQITAVTTRSQARKETEELAKKIEPEPPEVHCLPDPIDLGPRTVDEVGAAIGDEKPSEDNIELVGVPREELIEEQKGSQSLKPLFLLVDKQDPNTTGEKYVVDKGLLIRISQDKKRFENKQIVIPEKYRLKILSMVHGGFSGHLGVTKTKDRLLRHFFWPKCYIHVEEFVRSCPSCQRTGKPGDKKKAPLKLVPVISEPFLKLSVDAVGPLPTTTSGNRYLITAVCPASKFPDAVPVKDISSVSVTEALMWIFSRIGFPKEIQTDQGSSFVSVLTTTFLEQCGIKIVHSSVYHPQSNAVERWHSTLKRILRTLCYEEGSEWERHLPAALFAIRSVTNESSGFSPAELVYGKNLRGPVTLLYEQWMGDDEVDKSVVEYVFDLLNRLKHCRELAEQNLTEARDKNKVGYDRNVVRRTFKEGDAVMVLAPARPHKLAVQWLGPGTVTKRLSETNYVVLLPGRRNESNIYHVNMLKQYQERTGLISHISSTHAEELIDSDCVLPEWETNSTSYDFTTICENSQLSERLSEEQVEELRLSLNRFADVFSMEPGLTHLVQHDIKLVDDAPIRTRLYRMSPRQQAILKEEIAKMLRLRVIEEGESDYASPMILVEVPGRAPRPCIDYRRLNEKIETQFFPIPNIEERVERVANATYITTLDLVRGYWQIALTPRAQRYAAFVTPFGSFRPLRMPFGLKNAPYCFSKLMAELLRGLESSVIPYLDDIAVFSSNWKDHLTHIEEVLKRLKGANLTVKVEKCRFAQGSVTYLGHQVGQGCRRPEEIKVKAIADFSLPRNKSELRTFLGMCSYYQRYIEMYSSIASPLTDALKGKERVSDLVWTGDMVQAFESLKRALMSKPVLRSPKYDVPFVVQTDASEKAVGVVLTQRSENGQEHPVLFLSKKLSPREQKYSAVEKECLAIVYAVNKLKCYLDGSSFAVQTDNHPLKWLNSMSGQNSRLLRWSLILQPWNLVIQHRPGVSNANADCLSRLV